MQKVISPKQLSESQFTIFEEEYNNKRKYAVTTWLLAILLGEFGAHRFYLNDLRGGLLRILVPIGILIIVGILGNLFESSRFILQFIPMMLLIGIYVFKLVDWFLLPRMIYKSNKKIENDILKRFSTEN